MSRNLNHGWYNPAVIAGGKKLDADRTDTRDKNMNVLKTNQLYRPDIRAFNSDWIGQQPLPIQGNITGGETATLTKLTERYPFTYTIPDEKKWNVRRRFTDDKGNAMLIGRDRGRVWEGGVGLVPGEFNTVGKVMLDESYFDFVQREMEREEADAFKCFVFNNMDISTPVKKEYWKKRCPDLFEELKIGLTKKIADEFTEAIIGLNGPQNEEDYEWLWKNVVQKQLYTTKLDANGNYPPRGPTTRPYPQGAIDLNPATSRVVNQNRDPNELMQLQL